MNTENPPKKPIQDYSKEELLDLVKSLKRRKKYGLLWEPKTEDVVEQCKIELPVLEEVKSLAIEKKPGGPTNFLIEGDNYHALSVLNYTHAGKVDFIYIDPPYNTGAKDWKYNNKFVDETDTFRHSKWISFMEHRLKLAKNLLKEDGIICITIDDYEMPRLWLLAEEIFGNDNHLGTVVIRNNPKGRMTKKKFSLVHEYGIFFGKSNKAFIKKLPVAPEDKTHNYKQDTDGTWFLPVNLRKQGVDSTAENRKGQISGRYFPIYFDPKTGQVSTKKKLKVELLPIDPTGQKRIWRRSQDVIDEMYESGDIWVKKVKDNYQVYYKFRGGLEGQTPHSIWYESEFSASEYGTQILDKIMGERESFPYPKSPFAVMKSILSGTNNPNAVVVDFFAGSGTTGHAVLKLNEEDQGNRKFILVTNNENEIAKTITYTRLKKVIGGYSGQEGIPANLRYFKTNFVKKDKASDDTRRALVKKSTEMICVREDSFKKKHDDERYKIFVNDTLTTGILFDLDAIEEFKKAIEKLNLPAHLYVFSLTNDVFEEDFDDLGITHSIIPIPESILEVYRRIFN